MRKRIAKTVISLGLALLTTFQGVAVSYAFNGDYRLYNDLNISGEGLEAEFYLEKNWNESLVSAAIRSFYDSSEKAKASSADLPGKDYHTSIYEFYDTATAADSVARFLKKPDRAGTARSGDYLKRVIRTAELPEEGIPASDSLKEGILAVSGWEQSGAELFFGQDYVPEEGDFIFLGKMAGRNGDRISTAGSLRSDRPEGRDLKVLSDKAVLGGIVLENASGYVSFLCSTEKNEVRIGAVRSDSPAVLGYISVQALYDRYRANYGDDRAEEEITEQAEAGANGKKALKKSNYLKAETPAATVPFDCTENVGGYLVSIHAEDGILPPGTRAVIRPVTTAGGRNIMSLLQEQNEHETIIKTVSFDITFICDGTEIQPEDGLVSVSIQVKDDFLQGDGMDDTEVAVYHIGDEIEEIDSELANGEIIYQAASFSTFAIAIRKAAALNADVEGTYEYVGKYNTVDAPLVNDGDGVAGLAFVADNSIERDQVTVTLKAGRAIVAPMPSVDPTAASLEPEFKEAAEMDSDFYYNYHDMANLPDGRLMLVHDTGALLVYRKIDPSIEDKRNGVYEVVGEYVHDGESTSPEGYKPFFIYEPEVPAYYKSLYGYTDTIELYYTDADHYETSKHFMAEGSRYNVFNNRAEYYYYEMYSFTDDYEGMDPVMSDAIRSELEKEGISAESFYAISIPEPFGPMLIYAKKTSSQSGGKEPGKDEGKQQETEPEPQEIRDDQDDDDLIYLAYNVSTRRNDRKAGWKKPGRWAQETLGDTACWVYYENGGQKATGFRTINGHRYYFQPDGSLTYNKWAFLPNPDTGENCWYYFNNDGHMVTGYVNPPGDSAIYYMKADGTLAHGEIFTDHHGVQRYCDDSGRVIDTPGKILINGRLYEISSSDKSIAVAPDGMFCFGTGEPFRYYVDGYPLKDQDIELNGKRHLDKDGNMVTGWTNINGKNFYYGEDINRSSYGVLISSEDLVNHVTSGEPRETLASYSHVTGFLDGLNGIEEGVYSLASARKAIDATVMAVATDRPLGDAFMGNENECKAYIMSVLDTLNNTEIESGASSDGNAWAKVVGDAVSIAAENATGSDKKRLKALGDRLGNLMTDLTFMDSLTGLKQANDFQKAQKYENNIAMLEILMDSVPAGSNMYKAILRAKREYENKTAHDMAKIVTSLLDDKDITEFDVSEMSSLDGMTNVLTSVTIKVLSKASGAALDFGFDIVDLAVGGDPVTRSLDQITYGSNMKYYAMTALENAEAEVRAARQANNNLQLESALEKYNRCYEMAKAVKVTEYKAMRDFYDTRTGDALSNLPGMEDLKNFVRNPEKYAFYDHLVRELENEHMYK